MCVSGISKCFSYRPDIKFKIVAAHCGYGFDMHKCLGFWFSFAPVQLVCFEGVALAYQHEYHRSLFSFAQSVLSTAFCCPPPKKGANGCQEITKVNTDLIAWPQIRDTR